MKWSCIPAKISKLVSALGRRFCKKEKEVLIISCRWKDEKSGLHPSRWKESPGEMWGQLINSVLHSLQLSGNPGNSGKQFRSLKITTKKQSIQSFLVLLSLVTFWRSSKGLCGSIFFSQVFWCRLTFYNLFFSCFSSFKQVESYILPHFNVLLRHNTSNLKTLESTGAS